MPHHKITLTTLNFRRPKSLLRAHLAQELFKNLTSHDEGQGVQTTRPTRQGTADSLPAWLLEYFCWWTDRIPMLACATFLTNSAAHRGKENMRS
jgi:hypothetical protein